MVEWLAFGASLVAIGISVVAYRSTQPKIRVTANGPAILIGDPVRAVITVRLANDGGSDATVTSIWLQSIDSHQQAWPDSDLPGPPLPYVVGARGGVGAWSFDSHRLAHEAAGEVRDKPLIVRAHVRIGTKVYRSRRVKVNLPGDTTSRATIRVRLRRWWLRITDGQVGHPPQYSTEDLRNGDGRSVGTTFWKGPGAHVRPFLLTLVIEDGDQSRVRVADVEQVKVPRMWPWRSTVTVQMPVLDDSDLAAGESYWWVFTNRKGIGSGSSIGALVKSEVERYRRESR